MAYKMKGFSPFTTTHPEELRELNEGEMRLHKRWIKEGVFKEDAPTESKKVVDEKYQNKNIGEILTRRASQQKAMKEKAKDVKYKRSPLKQYDPVKKPVGPVTPSTKAEYMKREVWNKVEKNKPKDDDSVRMTDKENKAHVARVTEYNKNKAKPHHDPKGLTKNIEKVSKNIRIQIDKLEVKGGGGYGEDARLSKNDSLKLVDLKREYADWQTMLHNKRGK